MEIQIKKAVKSGNSSAVILPKSWLNKEVRVELVEKSPEKILSEVLNIVGNYLDLKKIIGVYLVGSYARGEEDEGSDIDILVLTDDLDRKMISKGEYNVLILSSNLLKQKLDRDLLPIGPMIREAKPLLNLSYLDLIKVEVTKKNVSWYLQTTKDKLRIIKSILSRTKLKFLDSRIAYTLVLRIRTLYLINKMIKNEKPSKKELIEIIKSTSGGENAYRGYLDVKNNSKKKREISSDEARGLYDYLKNLLSDIKMQLN